MAVVEIWSGSGAFFNEIGDLTDGIYLAVSCHGICIFLTICIELADGFQKLFFCDLLFFQHFTESLAFEGTGI